MRIFYFESSVLALWLLFLFNVSHLTLAETAGLYNSLTDDVDVLNQNDFVQTLTGSSKLWFVEFYNSWCGHCIKFAPLWKNLATSVKAWSCFIHIGAIDCADEQNVDMCRTYDIRLFPTIKTFFPNSKPSDIGTNYDKARNSVNVLRHNLIDLSVQYYMQSKDPQWETLSPINSVDDILKYRVSSHSVIVIITEDKGSYLGKEVILDLSKYSKILIRSMLSDVVPVEYQVTHFPSLLLIDKNGKLKTLIHSNLTTSFCVNYLKNVSGYATNISGIKDPSLGYIASMKPTLKSIQINKPAAHMQDLLSGIHYMFQQEIAIRKNIKGKSLKSLQNFIEVLSKYFPSETSVSIYLSKVNSWLSTIQYSITGKSWLEKIDSLQAEDAFLPKKIIWIGCRGSRPQYRGYPCSLWTIFHALTVNAYLKNRNDLSSNPAEVLSAVSNYVSKFFGCEECSRNFQKMSQNISSVIHSHEDSVLWLWEAHNKVNKRLHNDFSEDPFHPKIQFPSAEMCPACHNQNINDNSKIIKTNQKWNKAAILDFMIHFYSTNLIKVSESIKNSYNNLLAENSGKTAESFLVKLENRTEELDWWEKKQRKRDLQNLHSVKEQRRQNHLRKLIERNVNRHDLHLKVRSSRTFWIFSEIDIGMCIIFYIFCLSLLIFLYFHFARRKGKRLCKLLPY
ncbi:sulfhydryl oxidase 1 [Octopus bimaculoides]|uniref:sulfhydryl oxidase 1 n=1 Tax=Octopus bimaculoides TaxID=37653 RepID=UPI0022E563C8|nr:sulfhydryl oxidase 1 [Octopus bimaculoides]